MSSNKVENRKSNFELLRIVCIIMIIILHYCNPNIGGALANITKGTLNYYIIHFIESLCVISVNTFIIMTGYFSYKKDSIRIGKVIKLIYLCLIYGVVIFSLFLVTGKIHINTVTLLEFIKTIFNRWFVIIYIILYLLIPYLNKLINYLNQKDFRLLIIIGVVFFNIWPTFFNKLTVSDDGYGIINFIILYFIGAYIKKYKDHYSSKIKPLTIYFVCSIITMLLSFYAGRAFSYNTIFSLIGSISFFLIFKNLNIKTNKVINLLASYTFSIYIIHENTFLSKALYITIFNCDKFYNSKLLLLNIFMTSIGIYLICIIIEIIRKTFMKKVIDDKIDNIKYEIKV